MSKWLLARLKEGSSWRGIVWLLTALGVTLSPEAWEYVVAAGMAIAGLLGVLLSESPRVSDSSIQPPPSVELGGRTAAVGIAAGETDDRFVAGADGDRLRDGVPTRTHFSVRPPIERPLDNHFSGGWGDR